MAKKTERDEQKAKRKYWKRQIEECRRSGISQAEYCRQHKLSAKSFTYWKRRFSQKEAVTFIPLQVKAESQIPVDNSTPLVLSKEGYRIEIKEGFKPAVLGEVLRTLRGLQC